MRMRMEIADVHGREILDSRGNPTVEVEITLKNGVVGRASVPSGASTGTYEAIELRDKEHRYQGLGVKHAVHNINTILSDLLVGQNVFDQREIDEQMIEADGTEYKGSIGANAIRLLLWPGRRQTQSDFRCTAISEEHRQIGCRFR